MNPDERDLLSLVERLRKIEEAAKAVAKTRMCEALMNPDACTPRYRCLHCKAIDHLRSFFP